jgi:hypothetical protein
MFDFLILNPKKRAAHKRLNDETARIAEECIERSKAAAIERLRITTEQQEGQLKYYTARSKYEKAYEAIEKKLMARLPSERIIPMLALKKEYGTDWFRQYLFERNGHQYHPFVLEEWLEK